MKFAIHAKKNGPMMPYRHAPLSQHHINHFALHKSRSEKRDNHANMPVTGGSLYSLS